MENNIEHDIKALDKILNSDLYLNKFPVIKRVAVYQFGNHIDIVNIFDESIGKEYWLAHGDIINFIWDVAKMAGVRTKFKIYP